jgi:hypothetical protein
MCGRFSLAAAPELLQQHFQIEMESWPALQPRYNIAPSQPVLAVVASTELGRKATQFRWGLIPRWSRAPQAGWINARSETVAEKPSFREAFRRRRCLIPADGFYEWADQGTAKRQPYWFYLVDRPVFAFAGIWERWRSPQGVEIETCAILNTPANRADGAFPRADAGHFARKRLRALAGSTGAGSQVAVAPAPPLPGRGHGRLPRQHPCEQPSPRGSHLPCSHRESGAGIQPQRARR